jgi:hypothetical protein
VVMAAQAHRVLIHAHGKRLRSNQVFCRIRPTGRLGQLLWCCRNVAFVRLNEQITCRKIHGLRVSTFVVSVIGARKSYTKICGDQAWDFRS